MLTIAEETGASIGCINRNVFDVGVSENVATSIDATIDDNASVCFIESRICECTPTDIVEV